MFLHCPKFNPHTFPLHCPLGRVWEALQRLDRALMLLGGELSERLDLVNIAAAVVSLAIRGVRAIRNS